MDLIEIRWHGRGGQGVVTASELFAEAAMQDGNYIQAFPEFGPERMGAPIKAFTRICSTPITIHSQVYTPNIVVVLDPTLLGSVDVTQGLGTDGILIVNTPKDAKEIATMLGYAGRLYTLDATKIALETIGRPVANTACAGALVKVSGLVSMDNMVAATKDKFREKLSEKAVLANIETISKAYEEVSV